MSVFCNCSTLRKGVCLRVKGVHMDLRHLFADHFSRWLTYVGRESYSYSNAHKDIDYYEQ